jgi:folate-binding protein YgfZ
MANPTPLSGVTSRAGSVFTEDAGWLVPAHFGSPLAEYEAARRGAVLFDRSHHGKIEATGNDAAVFLHNLSTNDVKGLAPWTGCEAFFCTPTAKVVSHALIYRFPPEGKHESLWLDLAPGLAEKTYRHLDRYIIGEDVALTDHTPEWGQVHLAGPEAGKMVQQVLQGAPETWTRCAFALPTAIVLRCTDPLGLHGYDLLCPAEQIDSLWEKLVAAGARPAGLEAWNVLRVEAGTPAYGVDLDESTFAPEVSRTTLAISYNKGCYLGQEPIVMARDRGVVQRGLVGLLLGDSPAPPGSLLFKEGKEVGRTTSSVVSPRLAQAVALAYVRRGAQAPGTELELEAGGVRRTVRTAKLPM